MAHTKLSDLFDPQVVGDDIEKKLIDAIRFAPLCTIDATLVGKGGDTLTMPYYTYTGAANVVAEGDSIAVDNISQKTAEVQVHKIGKAIGYTDEALLMGSGNSIAEEASKQLALSIADTVDAELLTAMGGATMTGTITAGAEVAGIAGALANFGEDIDGEKVLLVPPTVYVKLIQAGYVQGTEMGASIIMNGSVGRFMGCELFVSNRLKELAYIVKPGALRLVHKRDTFVEFDRDILTETNVIKATKIYAPYLYDTTKIVKVTAY